MRFFKPCLFSIAETNESIVKSSIEPVSSHEPPLPVNSALSFLIFYFLSKSIILNSFLFEGFNFLLNLITLLSNTDKCFH